MITYSEREVFDPHSLLMFDRAEGMLLALPSRDSAARVLRCHEVARIVLGLLVDEWQSELGTFCPEVVDGRYGHVEHSWIGLDRGPTGYTLLHRVILDVYAVGRMPPVALVDTTLSLGDMYKPGVRRLDIRDDVVREMVARMKDSAASPDRP